MNGEKSVRDNPPRMVKEFEQLDQYKTLYDDITNSGVELKYNHRHALGQLACIMVEIDLAQQSIIVNGEAMQVNGDKRNMVTKKNPAREALDKLRNQSMRLMREFKMTPASQGVGLYSGMPHAVSDPAENEYDAI